jgi:transposase-like protein
MKRTRRNHGAAFKAQVAFAAVKGDKTLAELATQFGVHPTQITEWKQRLLARAVDVFGGTTKATSDAPDLKVLHAKIGQLALENDFLEGALIKAGLLSAKRLSTEPTHSRWCGNADFWRCRARPRTISLRRCHQRI